MPAPCALLPLRLDAGYSLLLRGKWWYLLTAVQGVRWKALVTFLRMHFTALWFLFNEGGARVHDKHSKSIAGLPASARKQISIVPSQRGGGQGEDRERKRALYLGGNPNCSKLVATAASSSQNVVGRERTRST